MTDNGTDGWNNAAQSWSNQLEAKLYWVRDEYNWPAFASFIGPVDKLDTIDLGCGDGDIARRLAAAGANTLGLDAAHEMIAYARTNVMPENLRYKVVSAQNALDDIEPESADLITNYMCIMSIQRNYFRDISVSTKPAAAQTER